MKVLWFCNCEVLCDSRGSGTWMGPMALAMEAEYGCELIIFSLSSHSSEGSTSAGSIKEYCISSRSRSVLPRRVTPALSVSSYVTRTLKEISPNLIHIWGVESDWGLISKATFTNVPTLLTIQGLKSAIAPFYFGYMSWQELLSSVKFVEIIKRSTLIDRRRRYRSCVRNEAQIIQSHNYIETQSPWVDAHVQNLNSEATILKTDRLLRREFYHASKWEIHDGELNIFFSSSYPAPFKGLHVLLKAFAQIIQEYPGATLTLAGSKQGKGLRNNGYLYFVEKLIGKHGLSKSVRWVGSLDSSQVIHYLLSSHIAVFPSFIESYGVAMAEAMYLGVPVVSAYNGGSSSLARDEESCLFFPPGDSTMCAYNILRLARDRELCIRLSKNAIKQSHIRHNPTRVVQRQIENYNYVIERTTV